MSGIPYSQLTSSITAGLNTVRFSAGNTGLRARLANFRSLAEFFNLRQFSKPINFADFQSRLSFNLAYFATNYAVVFAILSVYSLLTNLLLICVILFAVIGVFGISLLGDRNLELGFATVTPSQLYVGLAVIGIPMFFIASPISTILWLIGASIVTIGAHSALMEKPMDASFEETV